MKNILKKITTILLLGSFFVLAACKINVNNTENVNKTGKVSFYVDGLSAEDADARTLFPADSSTVYDAEDLTDLMLTWSKDEVLASERFDTFDELLDFSEVLDTGTWSFTLQGSINYVLFSGSTTAVVEAGTDTEIDFTLVSYNDALKPSLRLLFTFDTDKEVTFLSGQYAYYTKSGSSASWYTISALTANVDADNPDISYFVYENKYSTIYTGIAYKFKFMDKDGNIAYCCDSAILEKGKTTSGEYALEDFYPGYKINYYFNADDTEPGYVDYYTTTEGYTLYCSALYTWYTDKNGNTQATAKGPGQASGDINLYLSSSKTYYKITLKDFDGNTVCTTMVESGSYYYFPSTYDGICVYNAGNTYFTKSGKYVEGIYADTDKTTKYTTSRYTPESDTTLYVNYQPEYKLTLVSLNSGEVLDEFANIVSYSLQTTYWNSYTLYSNYKNYYNGYTVTAIFNNSDGTGTVDFGTQYYPTADVTLYVYDTKNPVYYLSFVNQNGTLLFTRPIESGKNYGLNGTSYDINNLYYYYDSGYYAEMYYSDEARTSVLNKTEYSANADKTIYVDLYPIKSTTSSTNAHYNKAYKITAQGTNCRLVGKDDAYVDSNLEYAWYLPANSNTSSTNTVNPWLYYTPIDTTQTASYSGKWEEITPVNDTAYTADTMKAKRDVTKYTVTDTTDMIVAYKYEFTQGIEYTVEDISKNNNSSLIADSTNCSFYVIDETTGKSVSSTSLSGKSFTAPSTGTYTLYIRSNANKAGIKCGHHIYHIDYCTPAFNITYSNSDITITKTEDDDSFTLTAPADCQKYEWKMGNKVVGTEQTLPINKEYVESFGTIVITLRVKTYYGNWYTTTIFVESSEE